MVKILKRSGVLLLITLIVLSCSKFRKVQQSEDWRVKYEAAMEYYEQQDYYRAILLFEEIMPIIRGLPEGEMVQFYYAYAHFYQGLYLLSAHYFKTFSQTYSRSDLAQEAEFMHAYSLFKDSPIYNLDQTSTRNAIASMQLFINKNPDSEFVPEATVIINDLQSKLEKKSYENAKQYYKLGIYKSAIIAFDNFRKDYPSSNFNEEISYLKVQAQYELATNSIFSKQEERFKQTIEFYHNFVERYPNSEYLKDLKDIYEDSMSQLNKLAENN